MFSCYLNNVTEVTECGVFRMELDLSLDLDEEGRNKNYKNYEKFDKLTDMAKKVTEKMEYFKKRTTPEEIEREEKYYDTPVERYVFGNLKHKHDKRD